MPFHGRLDNTDASIDDGTIQNKELSNTSVSFGGVSLALGGTNETPAFNLTNAFNYPASSLSGTTLASGVTASSLTSLGTLTGLNVNGSADISSNITASRFISDVAQGTAPLQVISTTKVTNLNADLLDGSTGSYYLDYNNFANTPTVIDEATNAVNVEVTTSNSNSNFKVPFTNRTDSTTGSYPLLQDSTATFTYNPFTNTLTAGTFSGNATSATSAGDADLLDGQQGSYYRNASNINAGTLSDSRLPSTMSAKTFTGNVRIDNDADLRVGDGAANERILIQKADNNVSDHIIFYNGTTRIGEIGCEDTTWLRINQETAKNIYTPRYIRADGGFFVDGTTKGINGSGNFIGGTISGASDYGTLLRSNATDTSSQRISFQANATNNWDTIATASGSQGSIEVYNTGSGNDAFMSFHTGGDFALYFGLDADTNDLSVGGWSMGANKYRVWHAGNHGAGSGLNADNLDGYTWASSGKNVRATEFYADNWFRNYNSGEGLYNESTGQHFYSDNDDGWNIAGGTGANWLKFRAEYNGTVQGWLYSDNDWTGFLNVAGQWHLRTRDDDGYSPNWYFIESGNETWTGNPGNDIGKIEYHSNRFYIASGANSTEIARFRQSGTDRVVIQNSGNIQVNGNNVWHQGNHGSGSGLDADKLDGAQPSTSASNNTIVKRTSSGYIFANYFNTTPNDVSSGITRICCETGNDGYIRHATAAAVRAFINVESGATANQTASEILTAIKTVDGPGSGLDADRLDGQHGSYYLNTSTGFGGDVSGTYNAIVVANDSHTHDTRYYTESESNTRFLRGNTSDTMNGTLTVVGHVRPSANNTYDLGSDTVKWRRLLLAGNLSMGGSLSASGNVHCSGSMRAVVYYDSSGNSNYLDLSATGYSVSLITGGTIVGNGFGARAGVNGTYSNTFNIEWRNPYLIGWVDNTQVGIMATLSDYRIKRNVASMPNGALDKIKLLRPVEYQWDDYQKDNTTISVRSEEIREGFIAHEVQEIIPSAVMGEKDDPVAMQSLKNDAILAVVVKALQELSAKNDALEARIAQLESQ